MGCCESTCMLSGRELVADPEFKPLVLRHAEEPFKLNAGSTSEKPDKMGSVATSPGGASDGRGSDPWPSPGSEGAAQGGGRAWVSGVNLQPATSSEVVQFRRLQYRELTPEDYELLCLLDETLPKKNTAPPNVVTSLPRALARDCTTTECQICLTRLDPYMCVVSLPCGHAFHPDCISRWLTQCKGTCPLCNSVLDCKTSEDLIDVCGSKCKSILKNDTISVESQVETIAVKMLNRANIGRCGQFTTRGDGSCVQPGGGDDGPAE